MANLSNINNKLIVTDGGNLLVNATANLATYGGITIDNFSDPSIAMKTTGTSGWLWTQYITSTGTNNFSMGVNQSSPYWCVKAGAGMDSPHLVVDSSGDVGIGTSSTEGKLTISYTAAELPTSGTTSNSAIQVISSLGNQLNLGLNTVSGDYGAYIQASDNNLAVPYPLNLQPNGGNVGIGTTSPDAKLHIYGSSTVSEMYLGEDAAVDKAGILKYNQGDGTGTGSVQLGNYGDSLNTTGVTIKKGGNVGIGVANPGARLELDNPSAFTNMIEYGNVAWNQSTGHGLVAINRGSDGYVQLQITSGVDNADVFTIRNSGSGANIQHNFLSNGNAYHAGNVGIGVTGPSYKLDVEGDIRLGGTDAQNYPIKMGRNNHAVYLGGPNINTINVAWDTDSDYNMHINYVGYAGGVTRFRNLVINNGKQGHIATFEGSTGNVGIGTTGPATKLTVKGATQFGGNSTGAAPLTTEHSAYGTTQNLYTITLNEGSVWSPGIAVINFAASRSGLQKYYAGQIIVRLVYYSGSSVAGQGGWGAPSSVGAVVAYSGQAEGDMRVYVNGTGTGNPMTIQIGVRDIDDTTDYFVSDIRVTLRSGVNSITS